MQKRVTVVCVNIVMTEGKHQLQRRFNAFYRSLQVKGEIATSEDVEHCSRCGCRTGTAFQLDSGNLLGLASVCRCDPFIYPTPFSGACSLHELAHVAVESTRQAEAFEASATALHSLQSKLARR